MNPTFPVRRVLWLAVSAVLGLSGFLATPAVGTQAPPLAPVPVPAIPTGRPTRPGPSALPAVAALPDVMVLRDGRRVRTAAEWYTRRAEMRDILSDYATGLMPPSPGVVAATEVRRQDVLGGAATWRLVHLAFGPGSTLGFDVAVFVPRGPGPFPTVVFPSFAPTPGGRPLPTVVRPPEQGRGVDALTVPLGDQTARAATARAAALAGTPPAQPAAPPSDPESVARQYAQVLSRGYALVTYHYQDTGEDTIGRSTDGSWMFRTTRFFPAYSDYDWGLLGGWAWGVSRVLDYLERESFADRSRFIVTGHSRVGKAVLVAGAFDDRIALVAPAGSGAGGTGAYRFNGARGGGREGLADMMRKYPNWFAPALHAFRGDVDRLPFDQHWFIALVAPQAFLSLEGDEDQNCVPNALREALAGARPAFGLLGASTRIAAHYAPHRHAFADEDWAALLDFADRELRGLTVGRAFDNYPPERTPGVSR